MIVNEIEFEIIEGEIEILSLTQIHVPTNKGTILLNSDEFGYESAEVLKQMIVNDNNLILSSK